MKTGLLWFDDDPDRTLEDKVARAAAHYQRKHGRAPDLCFVHSGAFDGNDNRKMTKVGEVEIRAGRSILPHHFWIGVDDETSKAKRQRSRAQSDSLVARVEREQRTMTPQRARQMVMELEGAQRRCART